MLGNPGKYAAKDEILIWDNTLQGTFQAWGLEHNFNLGVSLADAETSDLDSGALSGFDVMPALPGWSGTEVARPDWAAPYEAGFTDVTLNRFYGSVQLAVTQNFDLVLCASFVDYENEGKNLSILKKDLSIFPFSNCDSVSLATSLPSQKSVTFNSPRKT